MIVYGLMVLITIWPALSIDILPLLDYPNHLARMHILTHWQNDPVLQGTWQIEWRPVPNLAMDLLVPPMATVFGVELASRLFFILAQLMPVAGVLAVQKAVRGRVGYLGLGAFVMAWSLPLAWGFLNFSFSVGLALLLFALWIKAAPWDYWKRLAVFNLATLALYFSHMIGLGGLVILIALYELDQARHAKALRPDRLLLRALPVMAMFAVPIVMFVMSQVAFEVSAPSMSHGSWYGDISSKFFALASSLFFYGGLPDLLVILFMAGVGVYVWRYGTLSYQSSLVFVMAGLGLLVVLLPNVLMGVFLDARIGLFFFATLLAGLQLSISNRQIARLLVIGFVSVNAILSLSIYLGWSRFQPDYEELRQAFSQIEPGARLMSVADPGYQDDTLSYDTRWRLSRVTRPGVTTVHAYWHASSLAIMEQGVFLADQFTHPSSQPLRTAPKHALLDPVQPTRPVTTGLLMAALDPSRLEELQATAADYGEMLYWADWAHDFEYLIVYRYRPDLRFVLPEGRLELVETGEFFDLYRIIQPD